MPAGDVGLVAKFLNTIVSWALDPNGYAKLSRERKLHDLQDALTTALDARAYDAADRLYAELRRVSQDNTP